MVSKGSGEELVRNNRLALLVYCIKATAIPTCVSRKIHVKGTFCEAYFKEILMKELIFTKEANKIISEKKI